MKTDARVRYTLMVIRQNFFQLLAEKPISKITVKELCERSEINRATFYKHYPDPYGLLETIEEELLLHLQEMISQKKYQDIKALYTDILHHLRENCEQYQNICSPNGDSSFAARIFQTSYRYSFPLIESRFSHLEQSVQHMLYYFISHGCSGVLQYWIEDGMTQPAELTAAFIEETMHAITEHYK